MFRLLSFSPHPLRFAFFRSAPYAPRSAPGALTSLQQGHILVVLEVADLNRPLGAGAGAIPAALAGGRIDLGEMALVDARDIERTDPHAGQAGHAQILVHLGHRPAHIDQLLGEDGGRPGRRPLGLGQAFFNGFRAVPQAAEEHPGIGEIQGPQLDMGLQKKSVRVQRQLQELGQRLASLGRTDGRG